MAVWMFGFECLLVWVWGGGEDDEMGGRRVRWWAVNCWFIQSSSGGVVDWT